MKKNMFINEFENAKKDESLLNTININDLLKSAEKETNKWIDNKTLSSIAKENFETIKSLGESTEILEKWCRYLMEFRKVNEIYELKCGIPTKIIRKKDGRNTFYYVGILLSIQFKEYGTQLSFLSLINNKHYKYNFDDNIFFQKITNEEKMLLTALEHIIH